MVVSNQEVRQRGRHLPLLEARRLAPAGRCAALRWAIDTWFILVNLCDLCGGGAVLLFASGVVHINGIYIPFILLARSFTRSKLQEEKCAE